MPTPDYTRGWSAALVAVEREVAAHGFYTAAAVVRGMLAGVPAAEPEPACRVGGDPPVPGVGWGAHPRGSAWIYRVARVSSEYVECWVALDDYPEVIRLDRIDALYRPGDPADQPCWRRE